MKTWRQVVKTTLSKTLYHLGGFDFRLQHCRGSVFFLTYHKVSDDVAPGSLVVSPDFFDRQIHTLKRYFKIVSLDEAFKLLDGQGNNNSLAVSITFDDGYLDNYENAFPIVMSHQVPITIFLATKYIGGPPLYWELVNAALLSKEVSKVDMRPWGGLLYKLHSDDERKCALRAIHSLIKKRPFAEAQEMIVYLVSLTDSVTDVVSRIMHWEQVREMQQSGLVTFGSHTVSHNILSRMPISLVERELRESRAHMVSELGAPPSYLAYPNGTSVDINQVVLKLAADAGYKAAFTTVQGRSRPGDDLFSLPRVSVTQKMSCLPNGHFSPELFLCKITGLLGY